MTYGVNWVAPDDYKGHGFTLKLSDCKLNIAGIRLKNSCCERATRAFRIFGILEDGGPWVQLLEGELDHPTPTGAPRPTLQTFHLKEAVETKFLKFDVDSYWGPSGGLNYLEVITVKGKSSCFFSSFALSTFSTELCNDKKTLASPSTVDTQCQNWPTLTAIVISSAQVNF